jgi:hypothetical protein
MSMPVTPAVGGIVEAPLVIVGNKASFIAPVVSPVPVVAAEGTVFNAAAAKAGVFAVPAT